MDGVVVSLMSAERVDMSGLQRDDFDMTLSLRGSSSTFQYSRQFGTTIEISNGLFVSTNPIIEWDYAGPTRFPDKQECQSPSSSFNYKPQTDFGEGFTAFIAKEQFRATRNGTRLSTSVFSDEQALLIDDPEHSEVEDRFVLLGLSANLRTLVVCHCYREKDEAIRIISARKAGRTEKKTYLEARNE